MATEGKDTATDRGASADADAVDDASSPVSPIFISQFTPMDVFIGGTPPSQSEDNGHFRKLLCEYLAAWTACESDIDENRVAWGIIGAVTSKKGRFLYMVQSSSDLQTEEGTQNVTTVPSWALAAEENVLSLVKQCFRDMSKVDQIFQSQRSSHFAGSEQESDSRENDRKPAAEIGAQSSVGASIQTVNNLDSSGFSQDQDSGTLSRPHQRSASVPIHAPNDFWQEMHQFYTTTPYASSTVPFTFEQVLSSQGLTFPTIPASLNVGVGGSSRPQLQPLPLEHQRQQGQHTFAESLSEVSYDQGATQALVRSRASSPGTVNVPRINEESTPTLSYFLRYQHAAGQTYQAALARTNQLLPSFLEQHVSGIMSPAQSAQSQFAALGHLHLHPRMEDPVFGLLQSQSPSIAQHQRIEQGRLLAAELLLQSSRNQYGHESISENQQRGATSDKKRRRDE